MKKQTLTFLGRDSGFGEKNNSAYIEFEDELILIDCGFTVFEQVKNKFDLSQYKEIKIIVTHLHNDHAGSLSQLILYSYFVKNKKITVLSKCEKIKEYLDITGTPEDAYELKNDIEFIKTEHTKYLDAYGFCLNVNGRKIVYTGDTNTIAPFMPYIENCDELYIDVSRFGGAHIKINDILDTLKNIKQKGTEIFLIHLDDKEYIRKSTNDEFNM